MRIGEHVRTDTGWEVVDEAPTDDRGITIGSNFMVGNGYLGYRGTRPDERADGFVGCVVSDTYDMADGVWRELCTVPNGLFVELQVDGDRLTFDPTRDAEVELTLQTGEYTHRSTWTTGAVDATVSVRRFASLADLHVVMQQVTVVAHHAMDLTVDVGIDTDVWSLNGDHLGPVNTTREEGLTTARCTTQESHVDIVVASAWRIDGEPAAMRAGDAVTITTAMAVATSNDDDVPFGPLERAFDSAESAIEAGYRESLEVSADRWREFWDTADVVIEGDATTRAAQAALRFSIWHNRIATPAHTDRLPIGARGLSCQAYQGAAFWDQEMFNLRAFLHTAPQIARNILVYRWRTLDGARRKARRLGYEGAYYAWISGTTGDELCPDFFFDDVITGRPIRNHFNVWQMHISPDIAITVDHYWDATGDDEFIVEHGAEIVFDVATFLASFAKFVAHRNRYEMIRLLGPDEWHENVDNDAYTNRVSELAARGGTAHTRLDARTPPGATRRARCGPGATGPLAGRPRSPVRPRAAPRHPSDRAVRRLLRARGHPPGRPPDTVDRSARVLGMAERGGGPHAGFETAVRRPDVRRRRERPGRRAARELRVLRAALCARLLVEPLGPCDRCLPARRGSPRSPRPGARRLPRHGVAGPAMRRTVRSSAARSSAGCTPPPTPAPIRPPCSGSAASPSTAAACASTRRCRRRGHRSRSH